MIVFGRLVVAMLIAVLVTALLFAAWSGILFTLRPHWTLHVLATLAIIALHFYLVRLAYVQIKRRWF
jgi:hypothetical protein